MLSMSNLLLISDPSTKQVETAQQSQCDLGMYINLQTSIQTLTKIRAKYIETTRIACRQCMLADVCAAVWHHTGTNYLYTPHRCTWLTMHRVIWLSDLFCQVRHFATRVWQVQRSRLQSLWHVPKRSSPVLNCSECVYPLTPVGLYYTRWTLNVWSI